MKRKQYLYMINIINLRMFLGDPLSIETHLNNDWSLLLRNLKLKEDYLFDLLHYNHKIVNQVREENAQLFVNDQILQHQKQLIKVTNSIQTVQNQEKEIYDKYQGAFVQEERAIKLMGRVGARILEIYHGSIDKCKGYDESLSEKYSKVKKMLVQLLNQTEGIYLDEIIKCVIKYSKDKLVNQTDKLRKLISALENGEYTKLKEVYKPKQRKTRSVERKIDVLKDLSKAKAEKQAIKTQQKLQQKQKKQKQKLMNTLYNTMQLSKQQFHDDEAILPEARIQKLFNQILTRNRYNSEQIIEFHSKKDLFEQKVKAFKEFIEKQNKKITQVFIRRPIKRQKPEQQIKRQSNTLDIQQMNTNQEPESNVQNIMTEGNIPTDTKTEKKMNNTEQFKLKSVSTKKQFNDLPNLFNSFLATNQNFSNFKFDHSNRQTYTRNGRNIFPEIGKGTSLDQKTQITKIKIDKILRTTIKNEDKVHDGSQRKHQNSRRTAIIHREDAKMLEEGHKMRMNIKNIDIGFEGGFKRVLAEKDRLKMQSTSQDHSLHVKKAELKYYEPKLNLIF